MNQMSLPFCARCGKNHSGFCSLCFSCGNAHLPTPCRFEQQQEQRQQQQDLGPYGQQERRYDPSQYGRGAQSDPPNGGSAFFGGRNTPNSASDGAIGGGRGFRTGRFGAQSTTDPIHSGRGEIPRPRSGPKGSDDGKRTFGKSRRRNRVAKPMARSEGPKEPKEPREPRQQTRQPREPEKAAPLDHVRREAALARMASPPVEPEGAGGNAPARLTLEEVLANAREFPGEYEGQMDYTFVSNNMGDMAWMVNLVAPVAQQQVLLERSKINSSSMVQKAFVADLFKKEHEKYIVFTLELARQAEREDSTSK